MKTAREVAAELHVAVFGYTPGENVADTTAMNHFVAAIEADRRELVEACAKVADLDLSNVAARIRALIPKEDSRG